MKDPYQVLNVTPDMSDEEIKKAYRELARKYHPDNYVNNPLADLAQEKMKEINEAYDTIMKSRQGGGSSAGSSSSYGGGQRGYGYGGYSYGGGRSSNPTFQKIRELLQQGNVSMAENLLNQTPENGRDAEWHFLKGNVLYQKGWTNDARAEFETACRMDPSNGEYRNALNTMNGYGNSYNPYQQTGGGAMGGCTPCDCCAGMMCADMCCNCY